MIQVEFWKNGRAKLRACAGCRSNLTFVNSGYSFEKPLNEKAICVRMIAKDANYKISADFIHLNIFMLQSHSFLVRFFSGSPRTPYKKDSSNLGRWLQ